MKLYMGKDADAVPLLLDDFQIIEAKAVSSGVVLDNNERNEVIGLEMLNLSRQVAITDLHKIQYQNA